MKCVNSVGRNYRKGVPSHMSEKNRYEIILKGQMKSGKNSMQIDPRTGQHYPLPDFVNWREEMSYQIMQQKKVINPFSSPSSVSVIYTAGDRRRRDVPGMMDALCHLFEHCGIVTDDSLLEDWHWLKYYDKRNPMAHIVITEK